MSDYYFSAEKMTVGYDKKPLIREISFGLNRGEILTLIGPNGAGKSTILKSITRQLTLIGGCVCLESRELGNISGRDLARKMAVVLTERIRPELMTCKDVVATGRYPYTGTLGLLSADDHRIVSDALKMVHALELADRDFNAISDGQRQRVLLARAICQEPEIIILDEPTSFLDVHHKLEFLAILKKLVKEKQVAVIMSLHELDLAQKISDRILCVKGDHIARYGAPEEIFRTEFIKDLYDLTEGIYDAEFGSVELPAPAGKPKVFVIAGGGSGIPVFRRLQREGIPFAVGVLSENDIDWKAASHLATRVISDRAFCTISEERYEEALECMKQCERVICTLESFGEMNLKNQKLLKKAEEFKMSVEIPT
ncbi:MAG: ABC transporter ATP-binding protein [Eubacteriales bacterium]|nr:ABC transporter ATP-binding protein [Eubacteriales bacterium]